MDGEDNEYNRGTKTMLIPAHSQPSYRDVTVWCIKFVLPEKLDMSGSPDAPSDTRSFRARFIANYIDRTFVCCLDPPKEKQ